MRSSDRDKLLIIFMQLSATLALKKAVTLGSPRTGVIAHVHPETSISKQQTHQSGEPIWHAFTQFVQKTSVPDSVICCC